MRVLFLFFSWLQRKSRFTQEEPRTSAKKKIYNICSSKNLSTSAPRTFSWVETCKISHGSRTSGVGAKQTRVDAFLYKKIRFPKSQIPITDKSLILTENCQRWVLLLAVAFSTSAPTHVLCGDSDLHIFHILPMDGGDAHLRPLPSSDQRQPQSLLIVKNWTPCIAITWISF